MNQSNSNSTNITSSSLLSLKVRYFGSFSYIFLVTCSLGLNLLLLICFIKLRKQLAQIAFFNLAWQMLVCDLMNLFFEVTVIIPESLTGLNLYPTTMVYCLGFIDSLGWRAYLFFAFYLTLNRLVIFVFPKMNQTFFQINVLRGNAVSELTVRAVPLTLAFIWVFAICFVGFSSAVGCNKDFDTQILATVFVCARVNTISYWASYSRSLVVATFPLIMLSIYLLVFLKLQLLSKWSSMNPFKSKDRVTAISSQSSSSSTSREMGFFIQSVIICGMLEVQGLAYDNLHYLEIAGEFKILPKLVQIWISILSCTCHSVVILCFNKRIRNQAKSVLMGYKHNPHANMKSMVSTVHSKDRTITAQQPTTQITRL